MSAYTVESLAERWAVSKDMIRKLIRNGELKAFHVGVAVRISAEEVARYENQ
jgi:excisionase family DNA binding protein